jgi:O-acetyl-ADP-ribose deacetylase (regulator of RNase III)
MKFELIKGNLLAQKLEVVVCSVNNDLILGGGISGEIRRTAGKAVLEECEKIGTIPLGQVGVTTAGELPFKHIFLAAVKPIGLFADAKSIRSAIRNCFKEAARRQIKTIGFPTVGTGDESFPVDKSAQILAEEMMQAARAGAAIDKVALVVDDDKAWDLVVPPLRAKVPVEMWEGTPPPLPAVPADEAIGPAPAPPEPPPPGSPSPPPSFGG